MVRSRQSLSFATYTGQATYTYGFKIVSKNLISLHNSVFEIIAFEKCALHQLFCARIN